MDEQYRSLLELLKEESAVVGRLVQFGQEEATALQEDDIPAIKSAISHQEEEIKRLSVLEERRAEVLASIDDDGIERAGEMKDELEVEGSRLAARLQELAVVNENNRLLANQALTFAAVVQEALADVTGGYDEKGRRTDLPGFTTIDTSA
jgi:flagellar biosynthesis/type III secretory pathway chaperone